VVEALKAMPNKAQKPRPAATVIDTSITPARPTPACDCTGSCHLSSETPAYTN